MSSLSRQLADWVFALDYDALPLEVRDRALGVTLQGLTSALLGANFPETQQALRTIDEIEGGGFGTTTVLSHGHRLTRVGAAFVNAEMMLCGGKWDTFRMVTHPGCAVLPAALAAAEATECSGADYLVGVVAGYEVMQRMAADFVPTLMSRGFHAGPVFGIFGAAVAAAKIMGLSSEQIHSTIAQCVSLAAGNLESARSGGRAMREGGAVRNALLAVAIARQGGRGGETTLEGEAGFYHAYAGGNDGRLTHSFTGERKADLSQITRGLGQQWRMLETLYRIYSTPGYNIAHVDVTAKLCMRDGIEPQDVERIECMVNWLETLYPSPDFPSRRTDDGPGRERPHYYAAYGVLRRSFPVTKQVERGIGEPDPEGLAEMMARVRVIPSHSQPLFAPRVTIYTNNGVAHTLEGSGSEFIFDFETLAQRLLPVGDIVPTGPAQYAELVSECRGLGSAARLDRLIALACTQPA